MSAGLSFDPKALAASAVICHPASLDGLIKCFLVHISQHQYLLGFIMLDDDRDQPLFIGLKLGKLHNTFKRGHFNILFGTFLFKRMKIHIRAADISAG